VDDSKKFRIIQTVASGGTAVLFKAVQTSLDRVVAVKRLHQHLTHDENFTARFVLEAKAAASLDHENIVRVIDFGLEDGCYQMVLEYVEGESLSDIMQRWRPIKCDLALAVVRQICLGLEHAHAKGIVHRDIKPGNIMLTRKGVAKITDFGLAKLTQAATSQTAANSILGTPLYMSPEQAFGESVDHRSDLFSLGTVLYELLTGKQPFASENYMGVIQNIINKEIPAVQRQNPDVPDEVAAIVDKALNKNREHRYQSAGELREAIESYLGPDRLAAAAKNVPALLEHPHATHVLHKPVPAAGPARINKAGVAALVGFVLIAAATAVLLINPSLRARLPVFAHDESKPPLQQANAASVETQLYDFDVSDLVGGTQPTSAAADSETVRDDPEVEKDRPARRNANISEAFAPAKTTAPPIAGVPEKSAPPQEKPSEPAAPSAREGWLSVNARPNAEIYTDDVYAGDTPPALSLKLKAGQHKIECRHPRYRTYTEHIKIVAGELSRRDITMERLKGIISLATQEGAELYVDGVLFGITPIMKPIELDAGPHMVTLQKAGFFTWSSEITVEPEKVLPLKITLSPRY
jgi:tRNA A-37 threonylcarbamoyl transferase component Bud32